MAETIKGTLQGMAIILTELNRKTLVAYTHITIPAIYKPDLQEDVHVIHDEGDVDFDYKDAVITYPDEYTYLTLDGAMVEGSQVLTNIKQVIEENCEFIMDEPEMPDEDGI